MDGWLGGGVLLGCYWSYIHLLEGWLWKPNVIDICLVANIPAEWLEHVSCVVGSNPGRGIWFFQHLSFNIDRYIRVSLCDDYLACLLLLQLAGDRADTIATIIEEAGG